MSNIKYGLKVKMIDTGDSEKYNNKIGIVCFANDDDDMVRTENGNDWDDPTYGIRNYVLIKWFDKDDEIFDIINKSNMRTNEDIIKIDNMILYSNSNYFDGFYRVDVGDEELYTTYVK